MSHPHIVRYHACWIEAGPTASSISGSERESGSDCTASDVKTSDWKKRNLLSSDTNSVESLQDSDDGSRSDISDTEDNTTIHDFDLRLDDLDFLSYNHRDVSLPSIRFADPQCSTPVQRDLTENQEEDSESSEKASQGSPTPTIVRRTCQLFELCCFALIDQYSRLILCLVDCPVFMRELRCIACTSWLLTSPSFLAFCIHRDGVRREVSHIL